MFFAECQNKSRQRRSLPSVWRGTRQRVGRMAKCKFPVVPRESSNNNKIANLKEVFCSYFFKDEKRHAIRNIFLKV